MSKSSRLIWICGTVAAALALPVSATAQQQQFITVGTGGVTGVYYPVGGAICRLVNANRTKHGLRCSVESTAGSVFNANALKRGELNFGLVQSDIQFDAVNGKNAFNGEAHPKLRSLFSLHAEPIHVMTRADANVRRIEELKGKRVNIGNPGSGQRVMWDLISVELGWQRSDFALWSELRPAEQASALCDNKIDAAFWAAGVPNGSTQEAASTCAIRLAALEGDWTASFIKKFPAYAAAIIPAKAYPGTDTDVRTIGANATFVATSDISEDAAYQVVKSVFDSLDELKQLHPALAGLDPKKMVRDALSAPLHPGAVKYFKEKGLL